MKTSYPIPFPDLVKVSEWKHPSYTIEGRVVSWTQGEAISLVLEVRLQEKDFEGRELSLKVQMSHELADNLERIVRYYREKNPRL